MSEGRLLRDIWKDTLEEGERRISREASGLAATGLVGGIDVMFGVLALTVVSGAVATVSSPELAHIVGSLAFGIALVLVTIGRSELFTENFLVPVGAVLEGRGKWTDLLRLWGATLVFNYVGLALFAGFFAISGVLDRGAVEAAGEIANTYSDRSMVASAVSAIAAGTLMTIFTFLVIAAPSDTAKIVIALLIGFVLVGADLNHAVVGFGEQLMATFGDATHMTAGEIAGNAGIAIAGNLIGGFGFVTLTRMTQIRGEPDD